MMDCISNVRDDESPRPRILSGKVRVGTDCVFGKDVVIDVAEEVVIGDRCTIPDNAYFGGRRVEIGDDFHGYSWEWRRLDIGRGRRDEEDAILTVGKRVTFHDNKIDLARRVTIGDDVGLSPEVTIYTHHYWLSPLAGFPCKHAPVEIGSGTIVGYRSTILAGVSIAKYCVIGAQSVVCENLTKSRAVYGGNPAKHLKDVHPPWTLPSHIIGRLLNEYTASCVYRKLEVEAPTFVLPDITFRGCTLNVEQLACFGEEDAYTDDLRDFLFKHGIRIYTSRRFKRMERR